MADIDLADAQLAINDANLLINASSDMMADFHAMEGNFQHQLAQARGAAKEACQLTFDEYKRAFSDLAETYRDLGQRVVNVLRDTLEADQEAKLIWDRMGAR